MSDAASHFFAAPALEAMEIHYYHVAQVCDPAISQNLRTLAHQPFWLDLIQPKVFAFVRENQRPNLQKSELRGLARLLRKPRCKFDFYRTSKSVFRHRPPRAPIPVRPRRCRRGTPSAARGRNCTIEQLRKSQDKTAYRGEHRPPAEE